MSDQAVRAAAHRRSSVGDCSAPCVLTSSCAGNASPGLGEGAAGGTLRGSAHTALEQPRTTLRRAQHQT